MKFHISPYHICWAVIVPQSEKGFPKYFKKTLVKNGFLSIGNGAFFALSYNSTVPASREKMKDKYRIISSKLGTYKRRIPVYTATITDKQFGMIGANDFAKFKRRIPTKIGYIPVTVMQYDSLT